MEADNRYNLMDTLEVRNDDVLIHTHLTPSMVRARKIKPFFEWFKESDRWFEERNIKVILAVITEGIDYYPEWVEYIRERKHRYRIDLHGHLHINFRHILDEDKIYDLIMPAKEKLEKTFDIKVGRWFSPFSKHGFPGGTAEIGMRVCERMGIKFHTKGNGRIPHRYFHFWNSRSVDRIKGIVERHV